MNDKYTQLKVKYEGLLQEISERNESMQISIEETRSDNGNEAKLNYLAKENFLLKDLNKEIKDKNCVMNELNKEIQEKNAVLIEYTNELKNKITTMTVKLQELEAKVSNKPTYANVATTGNANTNSNNIHVPKLIIKKKDVNDTFNLKEKIATCRTSEKSIQTKNLSNKSNDEIVITCMNMNSYLNAEKCLTEDYSEMYETKREVLNKPLIKIIGVENFFDLNMSLMENDINERNFKFFDDKCKVIQAYENKQNKTVTIIAEVSGTLHKNIKENKERLFVGHQNCRVYDVINFKPCFKCGQFKHNGFKCQNNPACLECAGDHSTTECKSKKLCCVNCTYVNKEHNKNYKSDHSSIDTGKCELLKSKIRKFLNTTEYLVRPNIPAYLNNTEFPNQKQAQHNQAQNQLQLNRRGRISSNTTSVTKNG